MPEYFESTVAFTEVYNFPEMTVHSTPLQIVSLLNDLYTCMDSLLPLYDVYKVETIKDSYMVNIIGSTFGDLREQVAII